MSASHDAPQNDWILRPIGIPELESPVPIPPEGLTLGRDPGCGVVLLASRFPAVSGHHARITILDGELHVEDLGSKNGVLVGAETVTRARLTSGDVLQLGIGGPRFAVLATSGLDATVEVPRSAASDPRAGFEQMGERTTRLVRAKLGIPDEGVDEVLARRTRRHGVGLAFVGILAVALGAIAWKGLAQRGDEAFAALDERTQRLEEELGEGVPALLERQRQAWEKQSETLELARVGWDEEKQRLEESRAALEARLAAPSANEDTAEEVRALRDELRETVESLGRFDPVNLESQRLERVSQVERTVVLIEARTALRHRDTGEALFVEARGPGGAFHRFNFEGRGRPFVQESTGSGFCITPEGWIISNAHVVQKKNDGPQLDLGPDVPLEQDVELHVVFTGESVRHEAELVSWKSEGDSDLALLKIEPFEGMPHLDAIDVQRGDPLRGSDVFLMGFPLGKKALQQGDMVIASTFRGIVSRRVGYYLQVDAAVHPGNSGGPVFDAEGNVIGVVVGMQALDAKAASSAIGYVIPIAEAGEIWPPPGG